MAFASFFTTKGKRRNINILETNIVLAYRSQMAMSEFQFKGVVTMPRVQFPIHAQLGLSVTRVGVLLDTLIMYHDMEYKCIKTFYCS
jgi:hypothetical protein